MGVRNLESANPRETDEKSNLLNIDRVVPGK